MMMIDRLRAVVLSLCLFAPLASHAGPYDALAGIEGNFPDIFLFDQVVADAATLGFYGATDACAGGSVASIATASCVAADPNRSVLSDDVHPTTLAQPLLGAQFALAIPEPSEMALLFIGLLVLVALVRRGLR